MMSKKLYEEIVDTISENSIQECQAVLEKKYPTISPMTLGSIVGNYVIRKMKRTHSNHSTSEQIAAYYKQFDESLSRGEPPGIIIRMAEEAELCPTLMARFILEGYLKAQQVQNQSQKNENDKKKESAGSPSTPVARVPPINLMTIKSEVSRMIKDTTELNNPNLAYEVHLCTVHDSFYGPIPDAIKNTVGKEYEQILEEKLTQLGLWFVDENELRKRGYDKTPDFKLELPVGIDGQVVNWIESKATFGDEETHRGYLDDQLLSYKNRYGPGLVIYWLGFVDTLNESTITPPGVMVRENMPTEIVHMKPNGEIPKVIPVSQA